MLTIKMQIDAPHIPEALAGYQVYDHGPVFPGIIARVETPCYTWFVASWPGEAERAYATYDAAHAYLLDMKARAATVSRPTWGYT